jgi:CheY-like chemotaxis protein
MKEILVAEDHEDTRELIGYVLQGELNCRVITVEDGHEAWLWLQDNSPSCVVVDVVMPRMDGIQLFEQMRKDERLKKIPVVAMTGAKVPDEHEFCRILTKPIEWQELVREIQDCMLESRTD